MSSGAADLFAPLFGDPDVLEQLSDRARVQSMLDVEAALAEVQADCGIIPRTAVQPIRAAARVDLFDLTAIARDTATDGIPTIALVRQLTAQVRAIDAEAARYVHWGATSQDIIDTALVMQLQRSVPLVLAHLDQAAAAAATHARRYIDTPMPGRTWLQQATPVTFGLKAAGWLDALRRQRKVLASALDDARVLQFGGASRTLRWAGRKVQTQNMKRTPKLLDAEKDHRAASTANGFKSRVGILHQDVDPSLAPPAQF